MHSDKDKQEKAWKDLVEAASNIISKQYPRRYGHSYSFEAGAQFARKHAANIPEVGALIDAANNLAKDCGCISPYRIDVQEALKPFMKDKNE